MGYDAGEVLPGLNENWTFWGANAMEWVSGFVVFLMISLMGESPAKVMPAMMIGWVSTTYMLASMRALFPDEERGVRNSVMTSCGFPPPGIPAPARIQPIWSASPVRKLNENSNFKKLGLDGLYPSFQSHVEEEVVG